MDLFRSSNKDSESGSLNIIQDPRVDTLLFRYILAYRKMNEGKGGMEGFRIQIYSSSSRNAGEESDKTIADFITKFPEIHPYPYKRFDKPNYFKVRVGDFRTKVEGTKSLFLIKKEFPNAYLVPDVINFPDLKNK